jgi:hypothetical protein
MGIGTNVSEIIADTNAYLTNFVKKEKVHNPIGDFIAPPFRVRLEAGRYARYTDDIHRIFENKIVGKMKAHEIQWDVSYDSYACEEYAMAKWVGDKAKAQAIAPIKLEQEAAKRLKHYQAKARDDRVWQIAGSAAVVTQTVNIGAAWAGAAGTPITDILTGMRVIEAARGVLPNKILVPTQVALSMIRTTEWLTAFQNAGNFANVRGGDFDIISALRNKLQLQTMVTSVRGLDSYKCTSSDPSPESMTSDSVLLFYSEPSPTTDCMTFMFSPYVKKDVITRTREPRHRGVYIDIYEDIDELLVEASCAYLMTNCI